MVLIQKHKVLDMGYHSGLFCPPPLLFLIYINGLHNKIRFSQPLHFADDTCLLNIQSNISKINKNLNKDLNELRFWLSANKISLNVAKTEVILFSLPNKTQAL